MKRVLSLVLALVMVFGTIMPAFAESTDSQAGQDLESYGIIAGNGTGLNESGTLTRAEMTVILAKLNGKATEAAAYAFESAFTDDADAWYTPWVAYAATQGWMSGYPDGTFKPSNVISAQEVNVLMVKALGYDVEWATANATATDLGVAVTAKDAAKVLRGEIFTTLRAALDVNAKDATDTLGTALALTGYVSPTPATPETLAVSKVMTDNRKTVVIEFNQELFKKSVTTTNFKVTGLTVSKAILSEDMKTVTLDMSAAIAQSKEIELVIEDVKTADEGLTIADYKEKFVVNDVTIPVVESITVIDAKHIKVQASEPMNFVYSAFTVLPGVKIDGNAVIGKVVADNENFTYTIELNSVKKEGSYKLVLEGLKDYSELAAVKKEFAFDVVKDDTAPVALSAVAASVTVVEVTFDEPLTTAGTITVNGKATTETFKADSNNKIVLATLDAADKLTLGATVEVNVKYKGQKDVVGNEVKTETSLTFKVTDDITMPTVALEVKAGNKMVFTFSKAMDTTLGKVIVLDKDKKVKKEVLISSLASTVWNADKTVLTVVASSLDSSGLSLSATNPAEAFMQLKDMKDSTVRANLLATTDLSATLLDTKKPVVQANYILAAGTKTDKSDDTVTFFFSEMMDEDTLKNLSNYMNGTASFATISGVSINKVATDMKSVTINYKNGFASLTGNLGVLAVKDTAGNMAAANLTVAKGSSATKLTFAGSNIAVAKSATQVKVTFNLPVKSIDPAAISILKVADDSAATTVSSIASIDGAVVTLNLVEAINTEADLYKVHIASKSLIKSNYNTDFDSAIIESTLVDEVSPTVASFVDGAWSTTPDPDAIAAADNKATIVFSEPIGSFTELTLQNAMTVKVGTKYLAASEYDLAIDASLKGLTITVHPLADLDNKDDYTLEVKLNAPTASLDDLATSAAEGNMVATFTKSITDFKYDKGTFAATITSATTVATDGDANGTIDTVAVVIAGSTNNLAFVDTIDSAAKAQALLTSLTVDNGVTDIDVKSYITGATIDAAAKKITFTLVGAPVATGNIKVALVANAVEDITTLETNVLVAVTAGTDQVKPVLTYTASSNTYAAGVAAQNIVLTSSEKLATSVATAAAAVGAGNTVAVVTFDTAWTQAPVSYLMSAVAADAVVVTLVTDAAANPGADSDIATLTLGTAIPALVADAAGNTVTAVVVFK